MIPKLRRWCFPKNDMLTKNYFAFVNEPLVLKERTFWNTEI